MFLWQLINLIYPKRSILRIFKFNDLLIVDKYIVPLLENRSRISNFDHCQFTKIQSRKGLKKAIKAGRVFINNSRAYSGDYIYGGEEIHLTEDPKSLSTPKVDKRIQVLYEDQQLACVYKPAGISTSGNQKLNLENCLSTNLSPSSDNDALFKPLVIHRLDYATSGIVLVGKTQQAVIALNRKFEKKEITKTYLAVTLGTMQTNYSIELDIDSKPAKTNLTILKNDFLKKI